MYRCLKGGSLRLLSYSVAAALLTLLLTDAAATRAPSAGPATAAPADEGAINVVAQKLCQGEPIIGTRIAAKRKCDTPAQLERYREQARELIEEYRHRPCMAGTGAGDHDTTMPC